MPCPIITGEEKKMALFRHQCLRKICHTSYSVLQSNFDFDTAPVVVICIDGCSNEYLDAAIYHKRMQHLSKLIGEGFYHRGVEGSLPSYTNVNNMSICCGASPEIHGIVGNYFYDESTGEDVVMDSSDFLRCETILQKAEKSGRKIGIVTAKDKLRRLLNTGLQNSISFSSERVSEEVHGIEKDVLLEYFDDPVPITVYNDYASIFVLKAGVSLIESGLVDFCYLTLTDYIQHKHPPESNEAMNFYQYLDVEIGRLMETGAIIGITADHGMNSKMNLDTQTPNIIYLSELMDEIIEKSDLQMNKPHVILPITDPYVKHHSSLGSFAMIYHHQEQQDPKMNENERNEELRIIHDFLEKVEGISEVYSKEEASELLELPIDRTGDIVILSDREYVLGKSQDDHDLSLLEEEDGDPSISLRSHGGRFEVMVPMIISKPLNEEYKMKVKNGDIRSFNIFDFVINGTIHT